MRLPLKSGIADRAADLCVTRPTEAQASRGQRWSRWGRDSALSDHSEGRSEFDGGLIEHCAATQRPFEAIRATIQAVVRKFDSTVGIRVSAEFELTIFEWLVQRTLPPAIPKEIVGSQQYQTYTDVRRGRTE